MFRVHKYLLKINVNSWIRIKQHLNSFNESGFNITSTNPSKPQFLGFQELKFTGISYDWRMAERRQRYVISHIFLGFTSDEIHKLNLE